MKRPFSLSLFTLISLIPVSAFAANLFISKPVTKITETQYYQYDIQLSHEANDSTVLRLAQSPDGMKLNNSNSLVWQTSYEDAGEYTITLEAVDGDLVEQQRFKLSVINKNRPPVITSKPITRIKENSLFEYQVIAEDADGDDLKIEFLDVPKAMQRDGNTLTWQTNYKSAGLYPVHIRVRDKESYTDQSFVLTVEDVNQLPVFTEVDQSLLVGKENQTWLLNFNVQDPDDDALKLSLSKAPDGLTLKGKTLTWKPNYNQAGIHRFQVIADDGKDKVALDLAVDIENVNRLPAFTSQPITQVAEPELYQYKVRAVDPDETPLKFSVLQGPEGMRFNTQNELVWQTSYDDAGKYPVTIEVSDGEATVQQSFELTVKNTNRQPIIRSTPIAKIKETDLFSYTFLAEDPDNDTLKVEYLTVPKQVSREDNQFTWQTDYKSAGDYPFHIRVSDKESSVEQAFVLHVENVNRKPAFTSKPVVKAIEAVDYFYSLSAEDADDEALTFNLIEAPKGMRIVDQQIQWKPNFDQAGKHEVIVGVSDGIDTVTQSFTIAVANTNREPTLADIDDQTVYAGETFSYQLQASDVDGDAVSGRIVHGPAAMRLNKNFLLTWKTRAKDIGEETIIIEVSDGDLTTRKHFDIQIVEKPVEPKE